MVNGVFTIPLSGGEQAAREPAAVGPLSEFVVGPENALAATALRPLLERAERVFSPLVLHGPHGSGKSHLARGLAAWWRQRFPSARVVCLAASEFAQSYANALEEQRLESWQRRLRQADLLVVEDLGQLSGKRPAQLELLHTLDALEKRDAAVVVTCGSLPNQASILLPALRSRLSAGLAVPLVLPAPVTRRAIVEKLVAQRGLSLPKRTLHSLADGLSVSVPALVSALLELEVAARDEGAEPAESFSRLLRMRSAERMPNLRDIASLTAKYFGLKLSELKSPLRRQPLVAARGVAMYLARQLTDKSLEQIGAFFGGRDHTTVLHGCRRTEKLLRRDRATRQAIAELKRMLAA